VKAALLLYQATGIASYLRDAKATYAAIRAWFLDPQVPLSTVYVFDDGTHCTPLRHRFFGSVNGNMIVNGLLLARATGQPSYREEAIATARAVAQHLADAHSALFVWRWPTRGTHTLTFQPGTANAKEGGSFLHLVGYDLLR
jgi:uncharacterized protein YyaL (SSP411 family)